MSNWTFQQNLLPTSGVYNNCIDCVTDHGTTVASFFASTLLKNELWRSTNGGTSWTKVASLNTGGAMGKILYGGVIAGNQTWYALGTIAGTSYKSTNDGVTWVTTTDALPGGGVSSGAFDGSLTCIGAQNNGANIECTVNGSALTIHATPADWAVETGAMLWDGSQFVVLAHHVSGSTLYTAFTAPSGFSAAVGPSWTEIISNSSNTWLTPNNGVSGLFCFVPGLGYAVAVSPSKLALSSTVAGLGTVTPTSPPVDGSAFISLFGAGGLLFWSNSFPKTYRSADGTTWVNDTFSQALAGSEKVHAVIYDQTNLSMILITSAANVFTGPPPIVISPASATVVAGNTQQFSATTVPANTPITWSCLNGTITAGGLYTAPATGFSSDVVTAAWQSNANVKATAAVTITANTIAIAPTSISVPFGGSTLFAAATSPPGLAARWSVNGIVGGDGVHGTIADGFYVAPSRPNGITSVTVTATRLDIPSLSASATVALTVPTVGGGSTGGISGGTAYITGKFRGPKAFPPSMLAKAATIPLRIYEPNENKTFKG